MGSTQLDPQSPHNPQSVQCDIHIVETWLADNGTFAPRSPVRCDMQRAGTLLTMESMLPVWDFSVPDLEQLGAEQAELVWNPIPEVTEADIQTTLRYPSMSSRSILGPDSLGLLPARSRSPPRNEFLWDRGTSLPQADSTNSSRRGAALNSNRLSEQKLDLLPTRSPVDTAQDEIEEPSQRQRTGSCDSSERSKAVNRESQRRFRLRQKVLQTQQPLQLS